MRTKIRVKLLKSLISFEKDLNIDSDRNKIGLSSQSVPAVKISFKNLDRSFFESLPNNDGFVELGDEVSLRVNLDVEPKDENTIVFSKECTVVVDCSNASIKVKSSQLEIPKFIIDIEKF